MGEKVIAGPVHKLPEDFREAIQSDPVAKNLWADITPLARNEWICWVISAKREKTRSRRITVGLDKMRSGMRPASAKALAGMRPCCFAGCPHR